MGRRGLLGGLLGLLAVALVVLAGIYFTPGSHAPAGQPALADVNHQSLTELQTEFNNTVAGVRVVLLLSPT